MLPHWAQVAFVARCARRAQPAFNAVADHVGQDHVRFLDKAISLAESAAANAGCPDTDVDLALQQVRSAMDAAGRPPTFQVKIWGEPERINPNDFAWRAAQCVELAVKLIREPNKHYAAAAGGFAKAACGFTTGEVPFVVRVSVYRDFECLQEYCERGACADGTPVPSEIFGPLWPDGHPEGWPVD